jgi:cell division protein FtsB
LRLVRFFSPGRILLVAIIIVAGYLTVSAGSNVIHSYKLASDESRLEDEVAQLETQLVQLEQIRDYLRTDEYIEYMARRVFGLVRPGENLVVVEAPSPQRPLQEEGTQLTWWQRLFGGY